MKKMIEYIKELFSKREYTPIQPSGVNRTIVPTEFLNTHPIWDEHLFSNIIID